VANEHNCDPPSTRKILRDKAPTVRRGRTEVIGKRSSRRASAREEVTQNKRGKSYIKSKHPNGKTGKKQDRRHRKLTTGANSSGGRRCKTLADHSERDSGECYVRRGGGRGGTIGGGRFEGGDSKIRGLTGG